MNDYIIFELDTSIIEVMKIINRNNKGMVYVVTNDYKLLGVITDGDIRRGIISRGKLDLTVKDVLNRKPITIGDEERNRAQEIMEHFLIRSIPVVSEENYLKEIIFINEKNYIVRDKIDVPVVIMAGGKGQRLLPYTQVLPKPLIPIGEKTITEHIIDRFVEAGCLSFSIIVNYKRNLIKAYFKDIHMDAKIDFIDEDEFAGTAGGLRLLHGKIRDTFFMTNCDILVEDNYAKILRFHREKKHIATLVCAVKNMRLPYGVVESSQEGKVEAIKEKPQLASLVNTGLYVLEPEFLDMLPDTGFVDITEVFQMCISKGERVGMYPISESRWMDMGQMDELEKMRERLVR